jgi:AraC-like DNA-binding protein
MSGFLLIDALARGGTLALLGLWSLVLLRDHRETLAARLAIALNLAIVAHVLITIPVGGLPLPIDRVLDMASVSVPALFWLFAKAWFDDQRRIGLLAWSTVPLSLVLVGTVFATWERGGWPLIVSASALRATMFGCAIAGLWTAWRGREGDLVEGRRRMRAVLVWSVGLLVLLTNSVEVAVNFRLLDPLWRSLVEIGITAMTFIVCAAMFATRQEDLLAASPKSTSEPAVPLPLDDALAGKLESFLAAEKPWRDERLTIAALATQLGEQEYRLRRLINRALGHRNFAQFLNSYRLDEVRAALADPAQRDVPILTIALDAGFGSLGPFNRAFREAEGMTPSEFRAAKLADSGIG